MVLGRAPDDILLQKIIAREKIEEMVQGVWSDYPEVILILGDGTSSQEMKRELVDWGFPVESIFLVDESYSTLEGRALYYQENPPRGWRGLLPVSLQRPVRPIDDYAARILLQRFFLKYFS